MDIKTELQQRLVVGGWSLRRHGKHEVWALISVVKHGQQYLDARF